jgi:hypothetical protein
MKVAYCTDIKDFQNNNILDSAFSKKYPGASWLPMLAQALRRQGHDIATGDIAISLVKSGNWDVRDVLVIEDANCHFGTELIELGAFSFLLICLESPLYAFRFYDKLNKMASKYKYRYLFKGAYRSWKDPVKENIIAKFINFHAEDFPPEVDWPLRKEIVVVASNKQINIDIRRFRETISKMMSPNRKTAVKNNLLLKRLNVMEYFAAAGRIDIYGPGWNQNKMKGLLKECYMGVCKDKIRTMSRYAMKTLLMKAMSRKRSLTLWFRVRFRYI